MDLNIPDLVYELIERRKGKEVLSWLIDYSLLSLLNKSGSKCRQLFEVSLNYDLINFDKLVKLVKTLVGIEPRSKDYKSDALPDRSQRFLY